MGKKTKPGQLSPWLQRIRHNIADDMLREIAFASHDSNDATLPALIEIRNGAIPAQDSFFNVVDALEIASWFDPENTSWDQIGHGMRGHWMRLFACTTLIRDSVESHLSAYMASQSDTIFQFVAGARKLEPSELVESIHFLVEQNVQTNDKPCLALGVLTLIADEPYHSRYGDLIASLMQTVERADFPNVVIDAVRQSSIEMMRDCFRRSSNPDLNELGLQL